MHLSRFPRLHFAHLPTALEPMTRLSEALGGPNLWIKRDDCTGLSSGGNKTRKLEFLMADAQQKKADVIITQGATQSNHARQTTAIAAKMGLECHILLGLVLGMEGMNSGIPVYGVGVRAPKQKQEEMVFNLAQRTADFMGLNPDIVKRESVVANSDYVGDGYGLPTDAMVEAVKLMAQYEGILLDPVYSGKGFSGLVDLIRKGHFKKGENVVFLHTGGSISLFGYPEVFNLPGYI